MSKSIVLLSILTVAACGPSTRLHGGGDDGVDAGPGDCTQAEVCNDGIDNDCDNKTDCSDIDCSGVGECPVCGAVDAPDAMAIVLPDGEGSGAGCNTDADCAGQTDGSGHATPNCIIAVDDTGAALHECHASYTSDLNFVGFPAGATLDDTSKLLQVCATMEHSYLHDMQMELLSPPDAGGTRKMMVLNEFVGRVGPEIYLGTPNDNDEGNPVAGVGALYCWDVNATVEMDNGYVTGVHDTLPAGTYKPSQPFTGLMGTPLNGDWQMRVTDLYPFDNGFLFGWSIKFDPSLVDDCAGPIIN